MSSFTKDAVGISNRYGSKYRSSVVSLNKREVYYENLKVCSSSGQQSDVNNLSSNSKYFSYVDSTGSGSALGIISLSSVGKNHIPILSLTYSQPLIRAHSASIADFCFHRFDQQMIYSCSLDQTIKLWQIPDEGLVVDLTIPIMTMQLTDKSPVKGLSLHPCSKEILAGRGVRTIDVYDTTSGQSFFTIPSSSSIHSSDIQSMEWSCSGEILMTTCKDHQLRLFDVRSNRTTPSATASAHTGPRFSRVISLGQSSTYLLTCGHTKATQEREVMIWDYRNMSAGALHRVRIDSGYGPLIPLFDYDHNLLMMIGKGDNSMRLFELDLSASLPTSSESFIQAVSNTSITSGGIGNDVTRGACVLPKQVNDYKSCEIIRVLKLTDDMVQPISVILPRVDRSKIHELYPDTLDLAAPTVTCQQWRDGSDIELTRVKLNVIDVLSNKVIDSSIQSTTTTFETGVESIDLEGRIDGSNSSRTSSKRFSNLNSSLKFRHMFGTESVKEFSFYNLQPDLSATDSPIIACSETCFALPYKGGGGPVFISMIDSFGKVKADSTAYINDDSPSSNILVNAHKAPVQDIAFSSFHDSIMATGSADSTIKIWDLRLVDGSGLVATDPILSIDAHKNSIRTVTFHPTVPHLLCSTSQDMTMKYFDAECGMVVSSFSLVSNIDDNNNSISPQTRRLSQIPTPTNVSYNYDGSLIAVSSKDRSLRIVDPRVSSIVFNAFSTGGGVIGRNLRVCWCGTRTGVHADPLLTVSSSGSGMRQLHLWDIRKFDSPTLVKTIDNASGQLFPLFDETMNTIFVAGKGDTIIRTYELQFLEEQATITSDDKIDEVDKTPSKTVLNQSQISSLPLLEKSSEFQSSMEPIAGICMLPKRCCNFRNVEMVRLFKLTSDAVIPISFKMPRAEHLKTYFHDDIYHPIRSKRYLATVSDWMDTTHAVDPVIFQPILESLQPTDMIALSTLSSQDLQANTPSVNASKIDSFRRDIKQKEEEKQMREDKFSKLQQLAFQNAQYNKNQSGGKMMGRLDDAMGTKNTVVVVAAGEEEVDSDDNWDD